MKTRARPARQPRSPGPPGAGSTNPREAPRRSTAQTPPGNLPAAPNAVGTPPPRPGCCREPAPRGEADLPLPYPPPPKAAPREAGADDRTRTGDLVLTKDALYLLSYIGTPPRSRRPTRGRPADKVAAAPPEPRARGTPDATGGRAGATGAPEAARPRSAARRRAKSWSGRRGSNPRPTAWKAVTLPLSYSRLRGLPPGVRDVARRPTDAGGEGRIRTSEASGATDLQSVAFDRSATSPQLHNDSAENTRDARSRTGRRTADGHRARGHLAQREIARAPRPTCHVEAIRWSWRRDSNPRPADYKSAALPD